MAIKINTGMVTYTADRIDLINRRIRDEYSMISTEMKNLQLNWSGEAATSCFTTNEYIKHNYLDPRYDVVAGLSSFMRKQVGVSYEVTEKDVSTAASAFK